MKLKLSNGKVKEVDSWSHVIVPVVENFDIDDSMTWESDRAWAFAKIGQKIWTGKGNEVATILEIN